MPMNDYGSKFIAGKGKYFSRTTIELVLLFGLVLDLGLYSVWSGWKILTKTPNVHVSSKIFYQSQGDFIQLDYLSGYVMSKRKWTEFIIFDSTRPSSRQYPSVFMNPRQECRTPLLDLGQDSFTRLSVRKE